MPKRTKFVLLAIFVALSSWLSNWVSVELRFGLSLAIAGLAYILSVWVLFDDLKGIEWLTLMVLPVMFTLGCALFANFLPNSIPRLFGRVFQVETAILLASIFRFIYYVFLAIGLYGVVLIENIFSVASIRTIQLFRAARSVNFILSLITSLFFYTTILSLRLPFWWIVLAVLIVSMILSFPIFWSVDLKSNNLAEVGRFSVTVGWLVAFVGLILAFWPIKPFMGGVDADLNTLCTVGGI